MSTAEGLAREQQKALKIFVQYRPKLHSLLHNATHVNRTSPLLNTNFVASSFKSFQKAKLPREQHWVWNQSNAKVSVRIDSQTVLTFRKISPRKRAGVAAAPSFKIWLFHIQNAAQVDQYFLWCEKGEDVLPTPQPMISPTHGISTEIGTIFPQQLSMDSFSFLEPFVDPQTAREFGWIKERA